MQNNNENVLVADKKMFRGKLISVIILIFGISSFLGVDSYKDFYLDIKSKVTGKPIDYSKLSEFCGWTGGKYPMESDFEYGLRSTWNMMSAVFAMLVISSFAFGTVFGLIFAIFYLFKTFD